MAAVQPLKYTGGAFGALDGAADDTRFNSLGVGAAAPGGAGQLRTSSNVGLGRNVNSDIMLAVGGAVTSATAYLWSYLYDASVFTATASMALQQFARCAAGVISAAGGITITNAATFYVDGAPTISGGGSITNSYALWVNGGTSRFDGRITGISAPTAASDAVRADEASIPVGAAPGTLTSAGGATKYSGPYTTQPNTTETAVSFLVPHAMVLRNLRVRAQAAPTGASVLFTAFVNELANTALEVDYLTTSSGTVFDTDGSITLAAGDRLSIKIVMNTGYNDNSMTDVRWSLDATRL